MGSLSSNNTKVFVSHVLHRLIPREIGFDVQSIFAPAVKKWLEATDSSTVEWVERAVRGDSFKPDNDEMKQSSSVMDLFQIIGGAVEFLKKLQWPDEYQNAKFATYLAHVHSFHVDPNDKGY
jgi:hypothetical protein